MARRSTPTYSSPKQTKQQPSWGREIVEFVIYILILLLVFFVIRQFFFVPVQVDGPSMEPTLQDGDRLILNRRADIDHLDIVVFPAPDGSNSKYIKRVIGKEGDHIAYQEGQLYINDLAVREPYIEELKELNPHWEQFLTDFSLEDVTGQSEVPEDHYFVLGDNRPNSKDSRSFGFISEEMIEGTANFRIWPFSEFGFVN